MSKTDQEPCSVFTTDELRDLRRIPWAMRLVVGLFVAIVVLIFVPFQTVTNLGTQVGTLSAIQSERRTLYESRLDMHRKRIEKMEETCSKFEKRIYWIDRHSRETHEQMQRLLKRIDAESGPKVLSMSRRGSGPSDP